MPVEKKAKRRSNDDNAGTEEAEVGGWRAEGGGRRDVRVPYVYSVKRAAVGQGFAKMANLVEIKEKGAEASGRAGQYAVANNEMVQMRDVCRKSLWR